LFSCQKAEFQEDKIFVGSQIVTSQVLNKGHLTYIEYCVSCHGVKGDGKGIASKGLFPPPRDFTLGLYKFGSVPSGELPHDEDLKKVIKEGLHGTAMLPWDISEDRLHAVVQYLKTFAPKVWEQKDKPIVPSVQLNPNPFVANEQYAVERGKEVYHVVASCYTCHRAYISTSEMNQLSMKINNQAIELDSTFYDLKLQDSQYGYAALPPDFTWHSVRSAKNLDELAIRLAAGVGGTSMPAWKGVIEDEDIWAVAYYVQWLMKHKDQTALRKNLMDGINLSNKSQVKP
jgi:mono/diheme cytochrome c family protein